MDALANIAQLNLLKIGPIENVVLFVFCGRHKALHHLQAFNGGSRTLKRTPIVWTHVNLLKSTNEQDAIDINQHQHHWRQQQQQRRLRRPLQRLHLRLQPTQFDRMLHFFLNGFVLANLFDSSILTVCTLWMLQQN